jgi:uncharacterized repeat protein (TIGR04076 family)
MMNNLRFAGIGCTVIVEIIEAQDTSLCRFGYKVGDSWEVNIWENCGLCGAAYYNFYPDINMFQGKGETFYRTPVKDRVIRSCPDVRPGYRFLIRRKD